MAFLRAFACAAVVATSLAVPFPAGAGSTEVCAQRVIRDWYAGGRVDGVHPLGCYRAAIRALPEDVLQYSDARNDIQRALAYADAGPPRSGPRPRAATPPPRRAPVAKLSELATRPGLATASAPARAGVGASTTVRAFDGPVRLAAGSDVQVTDARGLPYPVLALATLAALLLATAAAARLVTRRRGPGGTPDR